LGIIGRLAAIVGIITGIHLMTRVIWWLTPFFGSPTFDQLHPSVISDRKFWALMEQLERDPFRGRTFWNYGLTDGTPWDTIVHHVGGMLAFGFLALVCFLLWALIMWIIYVPDQLVPPTCHDPNCPCAEHRDQHFDKEDKRWYDNGDGDSYGDAISTALIAGAVGGAVAATTTVSS